MSKLILSGRRIYNGAGRVRIVHGWATPDGAQIGTCRHNAARMPPESLMIRIVCLKLSVKSCEAFGALAAGIAILRPQIRRGFPQSIRENTATAQGEPILRVLDDHGTRRAARDMGWADRKSGSATPPKPRIFGTRRCGVFWTFRVQGSVRPENSVLRGTWKFRAC